MEDECSTEISVRPLKFVDDHSRSIFDFTSKERMRRSSLIHQEDMK